MSDLAGRLTGAAWIAVLIAAGVMAVIIGAVIWIFRHAPFVIG